MRLLLLIVIVALIIFSVWCISKNSENFSQIYTQRICPKIRKESRRLWYYHVDLTRDYIIKYLDDLPGVEQATDELMKNQEDLGAFIDRLAPGTQALATQLLKEHIQGAVVILEQAKNGNDITESVADWYVNADVIANTLAAPLKLCEATLRQMMREHLKTTLDEVTYHLQGNEAQEAIAYQAVVDHIIKMADYMVSGSICKCRN